MCFLLFLSSCTDFLEEKTFSFVSGNDLFKSEEGVKMALDGLYATLNQQGCQGQQICMWGKWMQYMSNLGTDELINANINQAAEMSLGQIATYDYNTELEIFSGIWFGHYVGIDRANNILANINNIEMASDAKKLIIAETKFLRGYFQFNLAWLYGGVPAPRQPMEDENAPRLSLEQVYEYVIKDLKDAYIDLPERNERVGHANRYMAASILSKIYIYLASFKQYNVAKDFTDLEINSLDWVNSIEMYKNAEVLLEDICDKGNYKMITPYSHLYYSATEAEAREESIFTILCSPGSENYLLMQRLWGPQGTNLTYGWVRPLNELVSKYKGGDPRKKHNITGNVPNNGKTEVLNGITYPIPNATNPARSNECMSKIRVYTVATNGTYGIPVWASVYDWPIIRYADIILSLAEVKYQLGDEMTARSLLHQVRLRSAKDAAETYPAIINNIQYATADDFAKKLDDLYKNTDFMDELMDERSRELCGEGWRRFDLIRTNRLASAISAINTTNKSFYWNTRLNIAKMMKDNFRNYKIWYPIPRREIELNSSLVQNYGYSGEEP